MKSATRVGIVGAGPAGLTLGLLLREAGIDCVILENRSREYVEHRVRAGLLEQNTVDLFGQLGVSGRLEREGQVHHGVRLSFDGTRIRVPFDELTGGRSITIYGQQEVVKDLVKANLDRGVPVHFEATVTDIEDIGSTAPRIIYMQDGMRKTITCDFVAGCDGYHGVSRQSLPGGVCREYLKDYPFSWLGILAEARPATEELIYAYHRNGFALHSLRSATTSRLYLQVENGDTPERWTDEQIWNELDLRLSDNRDFHINRGKILEKSITPMRSFMIDTMHHGRLFLAGDAAHIVPPTGGKGLNLAVADIRLLAAAITDFFANGKESLLNSYTSDCLRRIWRAQDFSNFMTYLFHKQAPHGSFEYFLQKARFEYIGQSKAQATTIAENYVGLKYI